MGKLGIKRLILCILTICMFGMPSGAFAAKKRLSEDSVTEFITKTSAIMSGHEESMSDKDKIKYLDKHIEKDARFKSTMQYNMPGYPSQETAMSFGKDAFIDNIKEGADDVSNFQSEIEILDIALSKDRKKAVVKTRSLEAATMAVPMEDGTTESVPIEGDALCTQIITVSKKGDPQMFSATCMTTINFISYDTF